MNELLIDNPPKTRGVDRLSADANALMYTESNMPANRIYHFSDVTVDLGRRKVTRCGESVQLTRAEFNLLAFFLSNVDWPLRRNTILNTVWGYDFYPKSRTVDVHVARLRRKLEPNPATPRHFLTIHGVGYRFLL